MEIDVELFTDFTRLNSLYLKEKKTKKKEIKLKKIFRNEFNEIVYYSFSTTNSNF